MKSMKVWRAFVAHLAVVLLVTTSVSSGGVVVARPAAAAQEAYDAEAKITAEETQEARELTERFIRRMGETNDLTPLIGEMFVPDYAERLHREALNESLFFMSKSVAQQASPEELARYYVALNNSAYVVGLLIEAVDASQATSGDEEEEEKKKLINAFPPDLFELFKNDPILKSVFEEEQEELEGENKPGEAANKPDAVDDADELIRSVEQLRNFTSTLEKASLLGRKHLGAFPVKPTYLERHKGANDEENWEAERDWMRARAWTLTKEFYGYPKGTRNFCVNALLYHMDLIRVDGKLKILALYPNME